MKVEPVVLELTSGGLTVRIEERGSGDLLVEAHVASGSLEAVVAARSVDGRSVQATVRNRDALADGGATFDAPAGAGESVEASRG